MSDSHLVNITPLENIFSITWIMHLKCNNDCMYCGWQHSAQGKVLNLEELKQRWTTVFEKTKHKNLKYKIGFTGGEVTLNRDFIPFIDWLYDNYQEHIHYAGLTSNGVVHVRHYLKLFEKINFITLSTHTESIDMDSFFEKAIILNDYAKAHNKIFMVNIMEEYWAWNEIKQMLDLCHSNNIFYGLSAINYNKTGSRTFPIFEEGTKRIERHDLQMTQEKVDAVHKQIQDYLKLYTVPKEEYSNLVATYSDGSEVQTYATRINFLKQNYFKGWECESGVTRIVIREDSSVWNAECFTTYLGNLADGTFELLPDPVICTAHRCTNNPDDIMVAKRKIS